MFRRTMVFIAMFGFLVSTSSTNAGQIILPHEFVNGTVADAGDMNENFDTVVNESNDQDIRIGALEGRLDLHVAASRVNAASGGTAQAAIAAAVNDSDWTVPGLDISNFQIRTVVVPPGGSLIVLDTVFPSGAYYSLRIIPSSGGTWKTGRYLFGVDVTTGGVKTSSVTELDIP